MNCIVFSDCHVDGVSEVMSRDEYRTRVLRAISDTRSSGGLLLFLGDNIDIKNALNAENTMKFKIEMERIIFYNAKIFSSTYLLGNHESFYGSLTSGFSVVSLRDGRTILAHHGDEAKYGKDKATKMRTYSPGCGKFLRLLKRIGNTYRRIFPWKLKKKSETYLSGFRKDKYRHVSLSFSGHEHPKKLTQFQDETCCYYIFPQGETRLEL